MISIIDADIVLHRVGYTTELDEEWIARVRTDEMLDGILVATSAKSFELWLSDDRENNFRAKLFPQYKANRTAPRPKHYDFIKEHLIREWGARVAHEMEADDAMGIAQDKSGCETVICSIDKDLLQIPGQHYNFVKGEWECVTAWEGLKWFYKQVLIGDVTDNVQGCRGVGPVKAGKAIDPINQAEGEQGLFRAVYSLYRKTEASLRLTPEQTLERILLAGRLLKIRQSEEEKEWDFPSYKLIEELRQSSTASMEGASTPSTEPMTQASTDGFQSRGQPTENTSSVNPTAST